MTLQASSGGAWRSLAALIALPFFSASSRKGTNPFTQACCGPPWGAPGGGPNPPAPPNTGAAPAFGKGEAAAGVPIEAVGFEPLTGGNAESLAGGDACPGNGAGNAPCARTEPVDTDSARR